MYTNVKHKNMISYCHQIFRAKTCHTYYLFCQVLMMGVSLSEWESVTVSECSGTLNFEEFTVLTNPLSTKKYQVGFKL